MPSGADQYGVLIVNATTMSIYQGVVQTYYSHGGDHGIFTRVKWGNSAWTAWTRCDNFGCNTASDLASLLGVSMGIFKGSFTNQTTFGAKFGILIVAGTGTGDAACYFTDAYHIVAIREDAKYSASISSAKVTITYTNPSEECRYIYYALA